MPFLIVSRTSGVLFVEKELSHLSLWQANNAISPEGNVFNEVHTIHIIKSQQETVCCLTLDILTRYIVCSH